MYNYSGKLQFRRMILSKWLTVFYFLAETSKAAVPSLSELCKGMRQLFIKDTNPVKIVESQKSPFLVEDIIGQGDALHTDTLNDDIETVVRKLNYKLLDLLNLGVAPLDAAPIINCFFLDVKELVLAAIKVQAYALLKLLQIIYVWRDEAQFHWFQALSYLSPWYDRDMWRTYPMNWRDNIWAIGMWDNKDLAVAIGKSISSIDELRYFVKELLVSCVKHDAIKTFKTMQMSPMLLERHLGLMAEYGSTALLSLYQSTVKVENLHLERYPPSKKLPSNFVDFAYLMDHGYDCFSMDQFIKRFCKEGRLDLLLYLHSLEQTLIPNEKDLILVAEQGWLDIIQWAHQLGLLEKISKSLALELAVNEHLEALNWLLNEDGAIIDDEMFKAVAIVGALRTLQWISEKRPFKCKQECVDLAAENCHFPVLEWIYGKFKLLPGVYSLRNATTEMLDWTKATDSALINTSLVEYGASNLGLLQWVHENAPISIFDGKELLLSRGIHNKRMMEWLYNELRICPTNMMWAYEEGDLAAIQWVLENCQAFPTTENIARAIEKDRLEIIKWFHENYPEHLNMPGALKIKKYYGSVDMADYLIANFEPRKVITLEDFFTTTNWDQRLNILKWIRGRKHVLEDSILSQEVDLIITSGQLQYYLQFYEMFPKTRASSKVWSLLAERGHHETYKWFIKKHPKRRRESLCNDLQVAFNNGHLEMVKVILDRYPHLIIEISELEVNRLNYHIKQWLIANFKPPKTGKLEG